MNEQYQSALPEEDEGIQLLDILQTLAENARLLVFGPILVGLVALGLSFLAKPQYVAGTSILIPQQQQSAAAAAMAQLGALAGMSGAAGGMRSPADLYVGLLGSRTIVDRMINRFGLMEIKGVRTREDARDILARISRVTPRKDGQITIEVASLSPQAAANMANAYVDELALLTSRLAVTEAQKRRQFLEKELAKAKENLTKAETALGAAQVNESTLKFNPSAMGQGLATLKAQIMAKELELASMRGFLTENSPNFRQARQELAALRAQLGKFENAQPTGENAEYIGRYREFKYQEVLFEQLTKQLEMAKIDELSEGAVIQVVDVAVPPERKANMPKSQIALLTTLAAGFVLLVFVFIRRAVKNASRTPEDTARLAAIRDGFKRVLVLWRRRVGAGR